MQTFTTTRIVPPPHRRRGAAFELPGMLVLLVCACGAGAAGESEESVGFLRPATSEDGGVLAAETAPVAVRPPGSVTESPPASAGKPVPAIESPMATPSESPGNTGTAPTGAEDLELASSLLHRPHAAFAQLVDRYGTSLGPERRKLLLSFSAGRAGDLQAARALSQGLDDEAALSAAERRLLQTALDPKAPQAVTTALAISTPLERAMELALLERDAASLAAAGAHAQSAAAWSRLMLAEIDSPWEADRDCLARWTASLEAQQRRHRWDPRGGWPAIEVGVESGDSLIAIRKRVLGERPDLLLCTGLIARANGLPSETAIRPGDELRIPTDRPSALVDVSARWTFYLLGGEVAAAWEVGVGREDGSTRPGMYTIGDKQVEPMWFQPGRKPVPHGDPENPLGTRWLAWQEGEAETHLGFHGTSDPTGVGGRVSEGCVRLRNPDIELLFDILPRGATVQVQP